MQPYFFPYIGYFQLINAVDEFVIYDNIQYTKKGWINRNRIMVNDEFAYITLPLKKDSDFLNVKDRFLAGTWEVDRKKMINRISESYQNAPFYSNAFPMIEFCIMYNDGNLFNFLLNSIQLTMDYLGIRTKLIISSKVSINHYLRNQDKVIAICKSQNASVYVNPIGGLGLYDKEIFKTNLLELHFQKSNQITYSQFNNEFIPWLSIIDVMMFNEVSKIKEFFNQYKVL